jgi:hypothetical protein
MRVRMGSRQLEAGTASTPAPATMTFIHRLLTENASLFFATFLCDFRKTHLFHYFVHDVDAVLVRRTLRAQGAANAIRSAAAHRA